jgi:tetratricopeptide (TPR) repeat protein
VLTAASGPARADAVRADLSATVENGHARLVFTFAEETSAKVQVSNGILIVTFARPVEVALAQIERRLAGYVQAARRDPDGSAVRFSLARKVTVNFMEAGEKLFVDMLPESWTGLPPGLPQSVIDELARRAREAEQRVRTGPPAASGAAPQPVRLRLSSAPTFARLAFELAQPVAIEPERDGQELRLVFDAPVTIDLEAARTQLPPGLVSVDAAFDGPRSIVKLVLAPGALARTFQEDRAYVVDVTPPPAGAAAAGDTLEDIAAEAQARVETARAAADADAAAQRERAKFEPPLATVSGDDPPPAAVDLTSGPAAAEARIVPIVTRQSGKSIIAFGFGDPVAAALFMRGDTLWIVFDSWREIVTEPIAADATNSVMQAEYLRSELGGIVRMTLARGRLVSAEREGDSWIVTLADAVASPSRPLPIRRRSGADGAAGVLVPLEGAGQIHRIRDPQVGDLITVVTAHPPARGVLRAQNFVEFHALASPHGLAVVPRADDLSVALSAEGVHLRRAGGLVLSGVAAPPPPPGPDTAKRKAGLLDAALWDAESALPFAERELELVRAIDARPAEQRTDARLMLGRFYLAHRFAAEAKGLLELGAHEGTEMQTRPLHYLLQGVAELQLGRSVRALEQFMHPEVGGNGEAVLLRGVAQVALGRFGPARDSFRVGANSLADLPLDFQRTVLLAGLRAAAEVRDFVEASRLLHELEFKGVAETDGVAFKLLTGRVAEGVGRYEHARQLYDEVAEVESGPAAAEAQLRAIAMRHQRGELDRRKAVDRLEALAATWRGDRIELETMRLLGRLYVAEARYRDAFRLLEAALLVDPQSDVTFGFQSEMATVFEDLYLTGKSETLPPVEALALYYDYNKLTPIGRRGDELIRRLVDRLVSVDLFEQAAELLEHQVEFRLTGAARAQVAARLAEIHLMNRNPEKAAQVLARTRMPALPRDLREQRLLLEARALSGVGRHEAGAELIEHLSGAEVERLRADIAWAAQDWREAGERLEKILGERWKDEEPLDPAERHDVLRAALAFAFGDDKIGLSRLREKYAERLGSNSEAVVLGLLASSEGVTAETLSQAAKALTGYDSLQSFLALYRERYPERGLPPDPVPMGALPGRTSAR